ncbi:MAG TPA: DUF3099 domain-containing protein [Streptosporangiaceae bacterium]|jgi:hypothetical protein|nr:DUF3099 domain-containing protein [Streptosporangiaceae bacterium]
MVTEARPSMSEDIAYRQRRYLIMMGIRAACFVIAIVLFVNHLGWLTAIPLVGAIAIPYFAVVFANGGREPSVPRGFQAYEPNLPVPHSPAAHPGPGTGQGTSSGPGADPGTPGGNGAPRQNT